MSRVGKKTIEIPQGVTATLSGRTLSVKGKLGTMTYDLPAEVDAKIEGNEINFTPKGDTKRIVALWGTSRARTAAMIEGVTKGYTKSLKIVGVGFRAAVQGRTLDMSIGYSHPVKMPIPEGIEVKVSDNVDIVITGRDSHQVGQFAANVRNQREPEPYKGKGIRYTDETVAIKEGKKK